MILAYCYTIFMYLAADIFYIIIFILGMCGFMVAIHIRNHKVKNMPLVCMAGFDCHTVVHSDYSRFFGIPVEILGMVYYVSISFIYLLLFFVSVPQAMLADLSILLTAVSLGAFLFSIYLIAVQIFILKKGCSWCFVSAFISILIFILTILI